MRGDRRRIQQSIETMADAIRPLAIGYWLLAIFQRQISGAIRDLSFVICHFVIPKQALRALVEAQRYSANDTAKAIAKLELAIRNWR